MRNVVKKITVILFLALMLINNSLLLLVANAVDEIRSLIDESKVKVLTEVNLEKYVNYSLDDENKGLMVQLNLKSGIEYEESQEYIPIKATGIRLDFPKVKDKFPERIEVLGISTKATNGGEQTKDWEYYYNSENGELKLVAVNNQDDNGNIYSENVENARDEYRVIAYYGEECYSAEIDKTNIKFDGETQINLADDNNTQIPGKIEKDFDVEDNISGLISTSVQTSDIYNGFIYSNKVNGTDYKTQYSENMDIDISYKNIADEVIINARDAFVDNSNKVHDTNEIIYKSTKINKQNVLDILGEDGTLKILNTNGEILAEINKDSETSDEGFIEVTYQDELSEIVVNLSKPVSLGTLNIENTKEIKDTMTDISNNRIVANHNIEANNNVEIKDEETDEVTGINKVSIYEFSNNSVTEIRDSETRVDVSLDKTNWTNNIQNDVIFTATLVSNESKYTLFKNPVIEIELPSEVDRVILGDDALLYENNFSLSNAEIISNGDNKVLRIAINGIQNQYILNSVTDGIHIVIPATIIMKKDIESVDTKVKYRYSNQNSSSIDYENIGDTSKFIDVHIKSIIQNFNESIVVASEADTNFEQINNRISTEVVAQVGKDIIENDGIVYQGEVINYIVRLKNETNQTINNVKAICDIPEGTTVVTKNSYFSDRRVEDGEGFYPNELYERHEDITNVEIKKEYLEPGEVHEERYRVVIDEFESGMTEKNIINQFKFYIGEDEVGSKERKFIAKVSELSAHLFPAEKQYFDDAYVYYLDIDNLTNNDLRNVVTDIYFDKEIELDYEDISKRYNKINYDENNGKLSITFDNIEAKEKKTIVMRVKANKFEEGKYEYNSNTYVETYTGDIEKYRADIESIHTELPYITIIQTSEKEGKELRSEEEIEYNFVVANPSEKSVYVTIQDKLPNNIKPVSAIYECYELQENNEFKKINKEEDISTQIAENGVVKGDFELKTHVPAGEKINIKIKGVVDTIFTTTEIVNIATVTGDSIFTEISNGIKNKILYYGYDENNEDPENPTNPDKPAEPDNPNKPIDPSNPDDVTDDKKYEINGVVWEDKDKDGRRTDNEKLLEGITVKLFDIETNKIVVDNDNNSKIEKTDSKGYYSFKDIKVGKYIVLFEFDTDKYKLTTYHKNSISETVNSDAILKEVSIDGKVSNVGVTDTIDLYRDYSNVDMGLIRNDEFDFKLDKYITKITVRNNGNDKSYDYNNSKLAKVEIPAKQLSNSVVYIEYKIVVTNEGNTTGYVKQIIDYLPSDLKFDAAYNDDWQKNINNYLINTSLSDKKLEPGQSQEVTLILTAQNITKNITNAAEIAETYNVTELKDIDSIEGNKDQKEDDYSEAQVIISIKTGIFINILKILTVIAIVLFIIFIIYKFRNKQFMKLFIMMIFVCGSIIISNAAGDIIIDDDIIDEDPIEYADIDWYDLKWHIEGHEWELVNPGGRYWCINPGMHLCPNLKHRYIHDPNKDIVFWTIDGLANFFEQHNVRGDEVNNWNFFGGSINSGLIFRADKTEEPNDFRIKSERTENKILVGPYKFDININDGNIGKPSFMVQDEKGNNITSLCDTVTSNGEHKDLNAGSRFYLAVPESVKTVKLTVNITRTYSYTQRGVKIKFFKLDANAPSPPYCHGNGGTAQELLRIGQVTKNVRAKETAEVTWTTRIPKGKIIIEKKDVDGFDEGRFAQELKNTWVEIKGDPSNSKIKDYKRTVIMRNNTIELELLPGKYTVREVGAPTKYSLKLQQDKFALDNYGVVIEEEKTIKDRQEETITLKNKQYSNLRITKKDDWTLNNLEGVEFYITLNGKYISNTFVNGSQDKPAQVQFTTNINNAYIFRTDSAGMITILNLPRYSENYAIIERGFSEYLDKYYKVDQTPHYPILKNNEGSITNNWSDIEILNKQEYIDISGFVWEDMNMENKISTNNGLYKNGDADVNDRLVAGIPVELKKDGVTVDSKVTSSDGSYYFESKCIGTYGYREILVDEISRYSVEFTYNGLKYKSVALTNGFEPIQTSSKAAENSGLRNDINNNFTKIDKGQTGTGVRLAYDELVRYKSSLISEIHYTVDSAKDNVSPQDKVRVTADTKTANYEFKRVKEHQYEVKHVNLGITLREQTDLAIMTDVNNINMMINGYTHTYNYKQRAQFENYMNNENDKSLNGYEEQNRDIEGYNALLDGFSVKAKANDGNYKNLTYKREIYPSYIAHLKYNNSDDKLRVFVRYKIAINNQSSSLKNSVNTLRNYCDTAYNLNNAIMLMSSGQEVDISNLWRKGNSINGYSVYEADLSTYVINAGEKLTMYLTYELSSDAIISLINNKEYKTKTNITEIVSYTTWNSDENAYGSIDRDSAPDNITVGIIKTYEDDTDVAPELTIEKSGEEKTLTGIIFEDSYETEKNGEIVEGHAKEALGNGKYEDGSENLVQGAKVRLLDSDNQPVTLYRIIGEKVIPITAENDAIGNNGKYEFIGLVPGVYYIEYEYGTDSGTRETKIVQTGKEVTTEEYKSTIITNEGLSKLIKNQIDDSGTWNPVDVNTTKNTSNVGYWYLNKYETRDSSSAIDNYVHRKEINEALSTVSYQNKSGYDGKTLEPQSIYLMTSRTPYLSVAIENDQFETGAQEEQQSTYETKFGIVVRPRQKFKIMKEISKVKLTLANGQILLEGDPRKIDTNPIQYLTYPDKGLLKIEVDNEIIQGATLEITYEMSATNLSALNYDNRDYYLFGYNYDNPVTSKIKLIDYLDKEVIKIDPEDDSSPWKWEAKTKQEMKDNVSKETINKSGDYDFYIPNNDYETIEISPGTQENLASIKASKLLSSSEDMIFDNIVEIYELYNPVGRFYNGTPGNYDFVKENAEEDNNKDPQRATVTVVPPTGTKEIIIYSLVGVGCLIILAGGIIFIKKKVL